MNCISFLYISSRTLKPTLTKMTLPPYDGYFTKTYYGLFGLIELLETSYIALIDECSFMGYLLKSPILRIESLFFVALNHKISTSAAEANSQYINMIKECVKEGALYFSRDFDFTYNMQTLLTGISNNKLGNGDIRYFFNKIHLKLFIEENIQDAITPVIYGFFSVLFKLYIDASFQYRRN